MKIIIKVLKSSLNVLKYFQFSANNQNARNFQQQSSMFGNEIFLVKDKDYLCRQFNPPDIRNIRESAEYQGPKTAGQLCSSLQSEFLVYSFFLSI